MSTFIPFNFDPAQVVPVGAGGNYTIPANYYAQVTVIARDGGSAAIDGTTILTTPTDYLITTNTLDADDVPTASRILDVGETFTVPTDSTFEGYVFAPNQILVNNASMYLYVNSEPYLQIIRDGSGVKSHFVRNDPTNNTTYNALPLPLKLGDGDTVTNFEGPGFWDDAANEFHIVGHIINYNRSTTTLASHPVSAEYWLTQGTNINLTGTAYALVTLYNKI